MFSLERLRLASLNLIEARYRENCRVHDSDSLISVKLQEVSDFSDTCFDNKQVSLSNFFIYM